jgi:hypothetical protein
MQEDGTFDFGVGARLHASSKPTGQGLGILRVERLLVYAVAAKVFHSAITSIYHKSGLASICKIKLYTIRRI